MTDDYARFLTRKRHTAGGHGFEPAWVPDWLYPFQAHLVEWSLREGRVGVFADCGLGKTPIELVWAVNVHKHTNLPVLIAAPLAVAFQIVEEATGKFGVEAAISRDGTYPAPITVTNYDRLHHFDASELGGMVCDESSAIKSFDSDRRKLVTEMMRTRPYRLLATATAAPNDYIELGTSSEALGHLGYMDMLTRFFVNDQHTSHPNRRWAGSDGWRFKGHAETPFWRWVASWARALRKPSDLGFDNSGFDLPPLNYDRHIVKSNNPQEGQLFDLPAHGLAEQRSELSRTLAERTEYAAHLVAARPGPSIAWCETNAESDRLEKLIPGAVQIKGSDTIDHKEEALLGFTHGEYTKLVTKPSIAGWGLNWQHCNHMTMFPTHSFEQYYQAVRRCWRFGQTRPVTVDIVTTVGGLEVLNNLEAKQERADRMFNELVQHMQDILIITDNTNYTERLEVPSWL